MCKTWLVRSVQHGWLVMVCGHRPGSKRDSGSETLRYCETLRVNSAPSPFLALSFTLLHRLQNCSTCKAPCGTDSVTGDAMANSNLTQHLQMSGAADFAAGRGSADTRKGRQHSGHLLQSALWKQFKSICGDRGTVCI